MNSKIKPREIMSSGAVLHSKFQVLNKPACCLGSHLLNNLIRRQDMLESKWLTTSVKQSPEGNHVSLQSRKIAKQNLHLKF